VSSMSNRALFTSNRKSRPLLTQGLMGRRKLVDSDLMLLFSVQVTL